MGNIRCVGADLVFNKQGVSKYFDNAETKFLFVRQTINLIRPSFVQT